MAEKTPLQEKLEGELQVTEWALLVSHHAKGRVLLVDPALPLVMVGMAVARDSAADVQGWLEASQIARPTPTQIAHWEASGQRLRFLIVQPFVLVCPAASDA